MRPLAAPAAASHRSWASSEDTGCGRGAAVAAGRMQQAGFTLGHGRRFRARLRHGWLRHRGTAVEAQGGMARAGINLRMRFAAGKHCNVIAGDRQRAVAFVPRCRPGQGAPQTAAMACRCRVDCDPLALLRAGAACHAGGDLAGGRAAVPPGAEGGGRGMPNAHNLLGVLAAPARRHRRGAAAYRARPGAAARRRRSSWPIAAPPWPRRGGWRRRWRRCAPPWRGGRRMR